MAEPFGRLLQDINQSNKMNKIKDKIKTIDQISRLAAKFRQENKKIVTTNGAFDIIHIGHTRYLRKAKQLGDVLVVAINSDNSVKKLKGDSRPINSEADRAEMLASLYFVDYVVIFDDDNPLGLLAEIKPDFHVKGGTYVLDRIKQEKDLVERFGGQFRTFEIDEGYSTTDLINKIIACNEGI